MSPPPIFKIKSSPGRMQVWAEEQKGRGWLTICSPVIPFFFSHKEKQLAGGVMRGLTAGRQGVSHLSTLLPPLKFPGHWRKSIQLHRIFGLIVHFLRLSDPKFSNGQNDAWTGRIFQGHSQWSSLTSWRNVYIRVLPSLVKQKCLGHIAPSVDRFFLSWVMLCTKHYEY